jgi:hypothetical protein
MRALRNQMSERVTRVGSRPWQACPLKANCHTFSIPISSSVGCHEATFGGALLDHLVGHGEERKGHGDAQRLRGL